MTSFFVAMLYVFIAPFVVPVALVVRASVWAIYALRQDCRP